MVHSSSSLRPAADSAEARAQGERFRKLSTLSERGVFGTYEVFDSDLGRRVLLRTTLPSIARTPAISERIANEAKCRARCSGDRVLPLFENRCDADPPGYTFAAPEGPTLRVLADKVHAIGGPDGAEALTVFVELAALLREVHSAGVELGGLTPSGVHVNNSRGIVLADMDSCRNADASGVAPLGDTGRDPAYCAPEQLMGEVGGTASDVFAAALVALEFAVGHYPFSEAGSELLHSVRSRSPAELPRKLGLQVEVERLLYRCLAKDEAARPESGPALMAELCQLTTPAESRAVLSKLLARCGFADKYARVPVARVAIAAEGSMAPLHSGRRLILASGVAMIVAGVAGRMVDKEMRPPPPSSTAPTAAHLVVLAHPWAEIWVDGNLVETTPLARPIVLSPGKHVVHFKHPSAPEEKRFIDLAPGQVLKIDIEMAVKRPTPRPANEATP